MRLSQENQFNMFKMVQGVCERHSETWNSLPAFVESYNLFITNMETIKENIATQKRVITGITDEKNASKEAMQKQALIIADAVFAYADKNEDLDLMAKMKLTPSSISKGKNSEVIQRCQNIKEEAAAVTAELSDFGVNEAELEKVQSAIDEYKELEKTPRLNIIDRKAATESIGKLIAVNSRIIKNQLDKLISQFEETNAEFYQDYFNAREIIDMRGGSKSKDEDETEEKEIDQGSTSQDMDDAA